jgi:DNA-binding response OmpR family regulator
VSQSGPPQEGPASPKVHILLADDDQWTAHMVGMVLERRGYSVETAHDGEDALRRALARPPDLLITDALMPLLDGWSLVKALRARTEFAHLPVIFLSALSSDEDRIRGFRLGADDYVTKPFRFEEFDFRVARTVARTRAMVQDVRDRLQQAQQHVGLRGDLAHIGIAGLLTLVELERKTGRLTVRSHDGQSAYLTLREGRVIQAALDGRRQLVDAACVYYTLSWGAGDFELVTCAVDGPDRIGESTTHLLLEGARLLDEDRRFA